VTSKLTSMVRGRYSSGGGLRAGEPLWWALSANANLYRGCGTHTGPTPACPDASVGFSRF